MRLVWMYSQVVYKTALQDEDGNWYSRVGGTATVESSETLAFSNSDVYNLGAGQIDGLLGARAYDIHLQVSNSSGASVSEFISFYTVPDINDLTVNQNSGDRTKLDIKFDNLTMEILDIHGLSLEKVIPIL